MKLLFSSFLKLAGLFKNKGLGRLPGIHRLYKLVYKRMAPVELVLDVRGKKMHVFPEDTGVSFNLIREGVHENFETKIFSQLVKPGMVVVDIGANIGYYTLIASDLAGKEGKIYSFEPEPDNYKMLLKNIQANNCQNVIVSSKALSNKKGKAVIFRSGTVFSSASLAKINVPECQDEEKEVETATLQEFFENVNPPDLIKIDTEGSEGLIIEGGEKLLKNPNLKILIEFWPWGLKNMNTDPLSLLAKFKKYDFALKLIDEKENCLRSIEPEEILKRCGEKEGINLLVEKC